MTYLTQLSSTTTPHDVSDYLECIKGEVLILFHSQLKFKKKKDSCIINIKGKTSNFSSCVQDFWEI